MKKYIILLVLLLFFLVISYCDCSNVENFANYKSCSKKDGEKDGDIPDILSKVLAERDITKTEDEKNYDIYIPCSYNECENEVLEFEGLNGKKLFLIDGCDWIASKMALWELLKEYYNSEASKYMPESYLLEKKDDIEKLKENVKPDNDKIYVLKNYGQRQEGLKLTKDLNEMVNGLSNGWYLAQEYIYNPYLIDNRKINFRYYMLVVCTNGKISAYIHSDGFLYYTPDYYDPEDGVPSDKLSFHKHITTGYIDRIVYDNNPLTLEDFRDHLDCRDYSYVNTDYSGVSTDYLKCKNLIANSSDFSLNNNWNNSDFSLRNKWNKSVETLMNKVMEAISKKICKNTKLDGNVRFQLFGCDVAPDANLGASLMEINKGPDLSAKDERDKKVKLQVQHDIFKIIDPIDSLEASTTRFVKIFESKPI